MFRKKIEFITSILVILDFLLISLSWILAYQARFHFGPIPVYKSVPPLSTYLYLLILINPLYLLIFKGFDLYNLRRISSIRGETLTLVKAEALGVVILIAITSLAKQAAFSRLVFLYFYIFTLLLLIPARYLFYQSLLYLRKRGYNIRRGIIVGCDETAGHLLERIAGSPEYGIRIEGFLEFDRGTAGEGASPLLGSYRDIKEVILKRGVGMVFISIPAGRSFLFEEVMNLLSDEMVDVVVVPDILRHIDLKGGIEDLSGIPVVTLRDTPFHGWALIGKRIMDILFSFSFLVLLSPLFLIISAMIKLSSRGPVFYRQERLGLDGRVFQLIKFRTMVVDAEKESGPVFASRGDERCFPFGMLLRRTSLDEIPQLINVLLGEMSIVGPRPERPFFIKEFRKFIPRYMLRHKVKAGITGWAQVNGWRGDTSIKRRVEHDIFYIKNWNLLFDLKIIWLTFWKGLINRGA